METARQPAWGVLAVHWECLQLVGGVSSLQGGGNTKFSSYISLVNFFKFACENIFCLSSFYIHFANKHDNKDKIKILNAPRPDNFKDKVSADCWNHPEQFWKSWPPISKSYSIVLFKKIPFNKMLCNEKKSTALMIKNIFWKNDVGNSLS